MMPTTTDALDSAARRALKARAHALKPVVRIAAQGLSAAVLGEIDRALTAHGLIKIHAAVDDRTAREALLMQLCAELGAQPVQVIGKVLVAYRKRPDDAEARAPAPAPGRKKLRRTKRSFQGAH